MALLDLASGKSLWRGLDYYKEKRVKDWTRADDGTYDGTVQGSELYHVHMDIAHPKRSTCDCPFCCRPPGYMQAYGSTLFYCDSRSGRCIHEAGRHMGRRGKRA